MVDDNVKMGEIEMKIEVVYIKTSDKDNCPMVNIDGDDFTYSNIFNMYQGGVSGVGIQLNDPSKEQELKTMCNKIADAIHEYHTK